MAVNEEAAQAHLELLAKWDGIMPAVMGLDAWLEMQRSLQKAIATDPGNLGPTPERAAFMLWNSWALADELHEMMGEYPWKPWATTTVFDRAAFIREAVDALHFFANLLLAAGCTGEELTRAYIKKNRKNLERQLEGYDGRVEKCGYCKRDFRELDEWQRRQVTTHPENGVVMKFCNNTHLRLYEDRRAEQEETK